MKTVLSGVGDIFHHTVLIIGSSTDRANRLTGKGKPVCQIHKMNDEKNTERGLLKTLARRN